MKDIKNFLLKESNNGRAKIGNVLEVQFQNDGNFYWHTPTDNDWDEYEKMQPWELMAGNNCFFIKIGDLNNL